MFSGGTSYVALDGFCARSLCPQALNSHSSKDDTASPTGDCEMAEHIAPTNQVNTKLSAT